MHSFVGSIILLVYAIIAGAALLEVDHCNFEHQTDDSSTVFRFDLEALATGDDFVVADNYGHQYFTRLCRTAKQRCLSALDAGVDGKPQYGTVVQMWGDTPPCTDDYKCTDPTSGERVCCTRFCEVTALSAPRWELADPSQPEQGGIVAVFDPVPPVADDPWTCT